MINEKDRVGYYHPCFSNQAHTRYGRIHLPVAPKCNIRCNYCDIRYDCVNESRPGVTSRLISPEQALAYVKRKDKKEHRLEVIGIAGPGEPLFNDKTFETFHLIHRNYPSRIKCLSTNGLLLRDRAQDLASCGVSAVTVTVNTLKPSTAIRIYGRIDCEKSASHHLEHCSRLLDSQEKGIEAAAEKGLLVKINTVLIPGVNSDEIREVAKFAAERKVYIMNIIPLIPQAGFAQMPAPSSKELAAAQKQSRRYIPQLYGCARCRADAAGIPGVKSHNQIVCV